MQRKKYKRKSPNKSPQIKNLASGPDIGHGEHSTGQIGYVWLDYVRIGLKTFLLKDYFIVGTFL